MKKRIVALLMALCLLVGLVPAVSAAAVVASGTCGENLSWVLTDDGTLTISGEGEIRTYFDYEEEVAGPGTIASWYDYRDQISNVVIAEGVTGIGSGAFYDYKNLKTVSLPSTLHYFGKGCFAGSGLTSIVIPEGEVTFIMDVFENCTSLEYVSLKNTVIDELYYTFSGCTNLKTVDTTGARITEDCSPYFTFADCNSLTSIDFFTQMEGISRIGYSVFSRCNSLEEITIPDNIKELDYWAVYGDNLKTIIFEGDAPELAYRETTVENGNGEIEETIWSCFSGVTANCYYPAGNETWTEDAMLKPNDGMLTWIPYTPGCTFDDVKVTSFYYEPVMWALEESITSGTSSNEFSPYDSCLRSQVVTFLWRAAGKPKAVNRTNPFVDVKPTDYYYDAVLWAVEQGITYGADDTHFEPNGICNRSQVVSFLYRTFKKPPVGNVSNPFKDVSTGDWYANAVLWAANEGIAYGVSDTHFGPNEVCSRSQVVTFLYRAYN